MSQIGSPFSKAQLAKLQKEYDKGPAAYGSIKNLAKQSKLPIEKVRLFLHSKDSYNRYHNTTRRFKRLSAYSAHINDIWCMDLAHVEKLSKENNGTQYLLVCVDIFSRFVRVSPMENKNASTTTEAFKQFAGLPNKVWVDKGKEFKGNFKKYCDNKGIEMYNTHSETKASFAERAIRSLKRIIYRHMEEKKTYRYINKLPEFVKTINNRPHRAIGMAPSKVKNSDVIAIHHNQTATKQAIQYRVKKPKFKVGDKVRIAKHNLPFRKGYKPQYTEEVFVIREISTFKPVVTYLLKDLNDEDIIGRFYEPELILFLLGQEHRT